VSRRAKISKALLCRWDARSGRYVLAARCRRVARASNPAKRARRTSCGAPRLALTEHGDVRVHSKSAYRDGTKHVVLEPIGAARRTRATASNAPHEIPRGIRPAPRAAITPAGPGCRAQPAETSERPVSKHVAMSRAQRLKRVFAIDIKTWRHCGGKLRLIASIEDPSRNPSGCADVTIRVTL